MIEYRVRSKSIQILAGVVLLVIACALPLISSASPAGAQSAETEWLKNVEFYTKPDGVTINLRLSADPADPIWDELRKAKSGPREFEQRDGNNEISQILRDSTLRNRHIDADTFNTLPYLNIILRDRRSRIVLTRKYYSDEKIPMELREFKGYRRYPSKGEISLKPTHVIIKTDPPAANVFVLFPSNLSGKDFMGTSDKMLVIPDREFDSATPYNFYFKQPYYKEQRKQIAFAEFSEVPDGAPYYPPSGAIKITPIIPVISQVLLYTIADGYRAARSLIAAIIIVIISTIIIYIGKKILRDLEVKKRNIRWDALITRFGEKDPWFNKQIGDYLTIAKIGAGGMATVYMAVPKETRDEKNAVAIKVMQIDMMDNKEYTVRFKREMHITSSLIHPNILKILDYGDSDGLLYIIMELVRGKRLTDEIPDGGMTVKKFMGYFRPLLSALEYAHDKGIVHRDLKPQNIMLNEDGRLIVMDFGLAREENSSTVTASGAAIGTPAYMSPEQASGKPFDARTDQYSLGIMAFQMLAGQLPFYDDNTVQLMLKHLMEPPPPLSQYRKDLPEELGRVIQRMLEKEPDDRYPSLREAHHALENIVKEHVSR